MTHAQGTLDAKQLEELARKGEVDTVLCMFTDLQGRFMGKRVVPYFFLEEILGEEGLHACLYLLAIDMEMEPLPGYQYASWETGYGDFLCVPDFATLRRAAWLDRSAIVICLSSRLYLSALFSRLMKAWPSASGSSSTSGRPSATLTSSAKPCCSIEKR